MWKKGENEGSEPGPARQPQPRPARPSEPPRVVASSETATIGPSITVKGDITGEDDLVIQGRVEGTVDLQDNRVTIGANGRVKADISAHTVFIEGEVEGDIRGGEQIVLQPTARVRGNMVAPRVILEDGSHFRGGIDMGEESHPTPRGATPSRPKTASAPPKSPGGEARDRASATTTADAP